MQRLTDELRHWFELDDFVAEHGWGAAMEDGEIVDEKWDESKFGMAKYLREPLKAWILVARRDIPDFGVDTETRVFMDRDSAVLALTERMRGDLTRVMSDADADADVGRIPKEGKVDLVIDLDDDGTFWYVVEEVEVEGGIRD